MVQAVSAAIVGIGATEFSKFSGRSKLRLVRLRHARRRFPTLELGRKKPTG
jgi:hypothetical protein